MRKRVIKRLDRQDFQGKKNHKILSPQNLDEASCSGHMTDLESDDNVLDNIHEMGLYLSSDEEHPAELNIAKEIDKAEKYRHTH